MQDLKYCLMIDDKHKRGQHWNVRKAYKCNVPHTHIQSICQVVQRPNIISVIQINRKVCIHWLDLDYCKALKCDVLFSV